LPRRGDRPPGGRMLGLIFGAATLGIIIAVMEQGEFPGWGKMILCVLAAVIPAAVINALLPPGLFVIGLAVGAVCAGFAISAATGMRGKRASIAAGLHLPPPPPLSRPFPL